MELMSMPTTVTNGKRKKNQGVESIYIGRPSIWGNPFVNKFVAAKYHWKDIGKPSDDPVKDHKRWLSGTGWKTFMQGQRKTVLARIGELHGKVLRCWCKPQPCHGDYLAELADALVEENRSASNNSNTDRQRNTRGSA